MTGIHKRITTQLSGQRAEDAAEHFLQGHGLTTLARNFRSKRGEIDLIMRHGDTVVFVEVRYRRAMGFGSGADTVDYRKRKKLVAAAQHYLQGDAFARRAPCRFDVVGISGQAGTTFDWIRNAFEAEQG